MSTFLILQNMKKKKKKEKKDLVGTSTPSFLLWAFSLLSSLAPGDGKGT